MADRSFVSMLRDVRNGASVAELNEQLQALVRAVRETGKKGKLTYTLVVKPASKGETHALMLEDAITVATPTLERGATIFFASDDNGLSRNDPRQPELPNLRVASHASARIGKEAAANE